MKMRHCSFGINGENIAGFNGIILLILVHLCDLYLTHSMNHRRCHRHGFQRNWCKSLNVWRKPNQTTNDMSSRDVLNKHVKFFHTKKTKEFSCLDCNKAFFTKSDLNHHQNIHKHNGEGFLVLWSVNGVSYN